MKADHVMAPVVVGLDLSLRATGIAHPDGDVEVFRPEADPTSNHGLDRYAEIRDHILAVTDVADLELVMIEALAFAAHDNGRKLAMLAGIVRMALFDAGRPVLTVAPGTLKKYATGSGKAAKEAVVDAAQKRLRYEGFDNNEADALWLRAIGWELVGVPLIDVPLLHQSALADLNAQVPAYRKVDR